MIVRLTKGQIKKIIKEKTIFQSAVNEVILEGITAYHGSPKKFSRFDLKFLGTGDGRSVYGDGVYVSLERDEAEAYSQEGGFLYTVDIPSYNGDNYIIWNKPIGQYISKKIAETLEKEDMPECSEMAEKLLQDNGKMNGELLFLYLREIYYPKQLGDIFRMSNVDGALVPCKSIGRKNRLVDFVIYNPENITITKVEPIGQLQQDEENKEDSGSSVLINENTFKLSRDDVRKIAKSLIKENMSNELNAYHGTIADFDRFDPNFMGSGEGAQMYGWGIYVTTNQQTGEHYADVAAGTNGKNEKYLYAVDIPDDNGKNYLNIEGNSPQTYDAIASGLMKLRPDAKDNIESCLDYCKENNTLMWLFQSQCDYAFELKELSELLNKIGYDGVKVPVKYREAGLGEEGYNYTIFDADKVKIVNKNRL